MCFSSTTPAGFFEYYQQSRYTLNQKYQAAHPDKRLRIDAVPVWVWPSAMESSSIMVAG
ncbi:hypothetical protein ACFL6N_07705 [Thermodesulfobacteriota bacterium]